MNGIFVAMNNIIAGKPAVVKGDPLPDALRKEIRQLIAVVIYCNIICDRTGDCNQKEQEDTMFKYYFGGSGVDDIISYVDLFLKGQDCFEFMFDNYKENEPSIKKLKSLFARTEKKHILGVEISKAALKQVTTKQSKLVTGRYLLEAAKDALAGVRKSLPFLEKYVHADSGTPKASAGTSGWEEKDIINQWLDDYHAYLNVTEGKSFVILDEEQSQDYDTGYDNKIVEKNSTSAFDTQKKDGDSQSDELKKSVGRPDGWIFPGILTVLLFGPFKANVSDRRKLNFMQIYKDVENNKKNESGRTALRDSKKKKKILKGVGKSDVVCRSKFHICRKKSWSDWDSFL